MKETARAWRIFLRSNWEKLEDSETDQSKGFAPPLQEEPAPSDGTVITLPPVRESGLGDAPFSLLLERRRSRRKYGSEPVSLQELSFLLWATQGIREHKPKYSFRTVPSGGARHPLDLYIFAARVSGLEPGLYRYMPVEHELLLVRAGDDSGRLDTALRGQYWNAALVAIWVAEPYRSEWRYSIAAEKLVALDAGHSCQNHYLACEALGLGTCAVGAYDQLKLDEYLGLDGEERFALYAAPVGRI